MTSSTAIVGVTCGIPVLVGAMRATSVLQDGQLVTLDTAGGIVYDGNINL